MSYSVNQLSGRVAGLDTSFSWRSVASTVVGATVGNAAGRGLGLDGGNLWSGVARSVVTGSSQSYFNQQWARGGKLDFVQLAMDSFGNALGNDIVGRMTPAATAAPVTLAKNGQRAMDMDGVNFLDAGVDTSMPDMRWIDDLNTSIATGSNLAVNANTPGYTATVSAASQTAVAGGYQNDPGMGTQMEITYNPNEQVMPEVAVTASAKEPGGGLLSWLRKPENISFVLDMVPVVGTLKSLYQAGAGRDLITGEAVNRWVEGAGIVAGMIPGGKLGVKGIVGVVPSNTTSRLATESDKALFWSGVGRGGDAVAANVASQKGLVTLETTLAQRGLKLPTWDPANPASVAAWREASHDFASGASGNVRVLQGDMIRIDSIWAQVEFPALRANPNVTTITSTNSKTGQEVLLWSRQ